MSFRFIVEPTIIADPAPSRRYAHVPLPNNSGFDPDEQWIFFASFGACCVVMYSIWPMVKLWWPGWVALPSVYHQKFIAILIFIATTSVLATYI